MRLDLYRDLVLSYSYNREDSERMDENPQEEDLCVWRGGKDVEESRARKVEGDRLQRCLLASRNFLHLMHSDGGARQEQRGKV